MGVQSFPKTFTSFFIFVTLACQQAFGQVAIIENFTDGNFNNTPTWSGTTADYTVTGTHELQLNNTVAATSYLSTPFAISNIGEASWEFTLHHNFAGSSTNYSRVYLMSTSADLTGSLNGYYLQFGEALSNDAVELFKQAGTTSVSVVRGVNASIPSAFLIRVRVTRDNAGTWQLFADYTGGTSFTLQGSATENTFEASSFFGIRSTYTVANANDVFFSNILVSANQAPDIIPPEINGSSVISSMTLDLHFTEALDTASVENIHNYVLKSGHQNPLTSSFQTDQQTVRLTFGGSFPNGVVDTLIVKNIQDTTMNSLDSVGVAFLFFQAVEATSKDIIINELFPDPSPTVGLPEAEFVELYNRSNHPFNLKGWKITDGTSTGILDSLILLPDEYCIITPNASFALYSLRGKTVHISSLPSLNNASDHIRLRNPTNKTIDSVSYTSLWYHDEEKDLGGWTLELIDPQNFCRGAENWRASVNPLGGTPGQLNSVFEIIPDNDGPRLAALTLLTEKLVRFDFNESMSLETPPASSFAFSPSLEIDSVYFDALTSSSLFLTLSDDLDSITQYTVQLNNIFDCPGNLIQPLYSSATFKLDSIPPVMDSVTVLTSNSIALYFSEPVNDVSAENVLKFQLDDSSSPASAVLENGNIVLLTFDTSFTNGRIHRISSEDVSDFAGNESVSAETDFLYFIPSPSSAFDVVITEIFADPTPVVGLPEAEFIEIFNRSNSPFQLEGWTLSDATSTIALPSQILLPNSYLILCSTSSANIYDWIGQSLGVVSFLSLNNTGEPLVLRDANGLIIDSIRYQTSWYHDDEKKDGGWTLERIDPGNVCSGTENWKASISAFGGTPGQQNSVNAVLLDSVGPKFISAEVDGKIATLHFNESLNAILPNATSVSFLPTIGIDSVFFSSSDRTSLSVELNLFPDSLTSYSIQLNNIFDCPGNAIQPEFSSRIFKLDTIPPMVNAVDVFSRTEVDFLFSEPVQMDGAIFIPNYITGGSASITSIQKLSNLSFRLVFSMPISNGVQCSINISNITDLSGNVIQDSTYVFVFFEKLKAERKDVVISEIFADPTPAIGLPEFEFLELHNRSASAFNLKGWTLSDGTTIAMLDSLILPSGQFLILCSNAAKNSFDSLGIALGVSGFPTLSNSGETLRLKDEDGMTIDSIIYNLLSYHDQEKKDGGWSIELIDPDDFCSTDLNLKASIDVRGGTPGIPNSVYEPHVDVEGPRFLNVIPLDEDSLIFDFNERLATQLPQLQNLHISNGLLVTQIEINVYDPTQYLVKTQSQFDSTLSYTVTLDSVRDCPGNLIQSLYKSHIFRLDTIPPMIDSVEVTSSNSVLVYFSESIQPQGLLNPSNYLANDSVVALDAVGVDGKSVELIFAQDFLNGVVSKINVTEVIDYASNTSDSLLAQFLFYQYTSVEAKDIIITEVFADPTPTQGLPEVEYLEIYNRSGKAILLNNWRLSDATSTTSFPSRIILPGEYLVVCAATRMSTWELYGETMGVASFPSLNNLGEKLVLKNEFGLIVDSIQYSIDWYHNNEKKDGGYSLEIIDVNDFCLGNLNWTSSTNGFGGTPGAINSVARSEIDVEGPKLLAASVASHVQINLQFDEALASTVPSPLNFVIEPTIELSLIEFKSGSLHEVELHLLNPLDSSITYAISVHDVTDCPGNLIQDAFNSVILKIDEISPSIVSLMVVSENELKIEFSEQIDSIEIRRNDNYKITSTFSSPSRVTTQDDRIVNLLFDNPFENAYQYELEVTDIIDRSLNVMDAVSLPFMFFEEAEVNYRDIIISEIFPDPSPVVSLPELEFVEIYNRSMQAVNLTNWTLSDGGQGSIFGPKILLPQHYLVLCLPSQAFKLTPFGDVLGVANFPSLNNADDLLILKNAGGVIIDSVRYSDTWYQDDEKKDGGWTLELIDPANVCAESSNWLAAESQQGGTPGKVNSVFEEKPDLTGPTLLTIVAVDPTTIKLQFNEKLSSSLAPFQLLEIVPSVEVESINFTDASLTKIEIKTVTNLKIGTTYSITLFDISDCAGNIIQSEYSSGEFALPEEALPDDLIINEVLFNPTSTGVDFVELYNNSQKFVNLSGFGFANLNDEDKTGWRIITQSDFLVVPNTFVVFTSDPDLLGAEYIHGKRETFHLASLPSLPDDEGSIFLIDKNGVVIDSLFYSKEMHSPFIKDEEGVSLERIGTSAGIDVTANWKSASSTSGFATPGYVNSNSFENVIFSEAVAIEPEIFSPYFGQPDFAKINYQFDQGGYIANVSIIDASGHEIKILARNELLGADGFLRWDGDSENGSKARIGAYTVLFELFDVQGNVKTIRKRVVIAGKF